jgi:hypothetical protein
MLHRIPCSAIYQLNDTNTDELSLREIKGFEKIQALSTNTYRRRYVQGMGATPRHFRQVNLLSNVYPRDARGTPTQRLPTRTNLPICSSRISAHEHDRLVRFLPQIRQYLDPGLLRQSVT